MEHLYCFNSKVVRNENVFRNFQNVPLCYIKQKIGRVDRIVLEGHFGCTSNSFVLICFNIASFLEKYSPLYFENCGNWNVSWNFRDVPRMSRYARNLPLLTGCCFWRGCCDSKSNHSYRTVLLSLWQKACTKLSWRSSYVALSKKIGFRRGRVSKNVRVRVDGFVANVMSSSLKCLLLRYFCIMKTCRETFGTSLVRYITHKTWRLGSIVLQRRFGYTPNSAIYFNIVPFYFKNCVNWDMSWNFRDVPRTPRYVRIRLFLTRL